MTGGLSGKRVLVVEPEYFVAANLKRALAGAGADVVGPVGELDAALALTESVILDAAVLDVCADGASSDPVANRLAAARVPHVFLGEDGVARHSDACRATPCVTKPFVAANIVALLEDLCSRHST